MSVYIKEPETPAQASIIWMHGLGADASDMVGLAEQLTVTPAVRHVFLNAPVRPVTLNRGMSMSAWYDIAGITLNDREDREGISASEHYIRGVMEHQSNDGFDLTQVFLAGFSQGAAMAIHTALHTEKRLGGVIALSGYLPLAATNKALLDKQTPFFIGSGQYDSIVLPQWTQQSKEWLLTKGYERVTSHLYPMEHSICLAEISDISSWLTTQVQGVSQ